MGSIQTKFGTIAFAKNISSCLLELNWLSSDNTRNNILENPQTSYKYSTIFVSRSNRCAVNLVDEELPVSRESNISANLNETSALSGQLIKTSPKKLEEINLCWPNINCIWNKFDSLVTVVNKNIDVFFISKMKLTLFQK